MCLFTRHTAHLQLVDDAFELELSSNLLILKKWALYVFNCHTAHSHLVDDAF